MPCLSPKIPRDPIFYFIFWVHVIINLLWLSAHFGYYYAFQKVSLSKCYSERINEVA